VVILELIHALEPRLRGSRPAEEVLLLDQNQSGPGFRAREPYQFW